MRTRTKVGLFSLASLVVATPLAAGCLFAAPRWSGPLSDHFDGEKFRTPGVPLRETTVGGFLKWQLNRQRGAWSPFRQEPPGARPPAEVTKGKLRVTFINHATTLVQLDGVNVLTDPIYSDRCSPVSFAGPKRVRPPGIRFEDLPRIDAVVISHNHYDHLDVATLKRVADTWPNVSIFVGLGVKAFLDKQRLPNVVELDWFGSQPLKGIEVMSVPNRHFSNRGIGDGDATLWTAWAFRGSQGYAYFAGDTAYGSHFKQVKEKLGAPRVAILPIGAFKPEWFMGPVHMTPKEAVTAARDLEAGISVPMHYGTFDLADDGENEPVAELEAALKQTPTPFAVLGFGEGRDIE